MSSAQEETAPAASSASALTRFHALFVAVLLFFFVSGACGLLYQVVWTRKLVLLFGTTSYAVSTVLSIFFLGLGAGSLWGGRLADRTTNPLRLYGFFEIIIGLWALFFVFAVNYGDGVVVFLLKAFDFSRATGITLRALLALVLLLVPVSLMGATLPLLARFVAHSSERLGQRVGGLYAMNTLGAVAGCFFTGFFLIPASGYTQTTLLGMTANVVIGLLAILLSRGADAEFAVTKPDGGMPVSRGGSAFHRGNCGLVAAFAMSGFVMLAMEVLWTRLLAIVFLGTTYAYTTMLTTLLIGIALGSAVASFLADRVRNPDFLFGGVLVAAGASCLLTLGGIADLPEKVQLLHRNTGNDWGALVRGKFLYSFGILFLPTFFSGMTFPLVVRAVSLGGERLGRDVGVLYCANTFGGVLGAAAGGFLLLPLLGAHNAIVLLSALLGLAGLAVLRLPFPARSQGPLKRFKKMSENEESDYVAGIATRLALLAIPMALMALATWRLPEDVSQSLNAGYVPADHRVLHYREGVEGTVAVTEPAGETGGTNRVLWINRVQATTSIEKGVKMNRLQGVLPLLFDRDPQRVLFMCFGSGITCGTLALTEFERIDAVEISPDVLEAAPLFAADNLGVLDRPNVVFHVDDGRNYLLTTDNRYDLITFEPMPLALAGVSTFYTREYYDLCLSRLAPGGMVSQWVPLHSLNPEVVRSLVRTFTSAFPEYCAWFINADLFLIGSNEPLRIDIQRAERRLSTPKLRHALDAVGLRDTMEVLACFLMDKAGLDAYAEAGEIMSDDRPWAEFMAPKLVYERKVPEAIAELESHVTSPVGLLAPGADAEAVAALERRHRARVHDLEALKRYYSGMAIGPDVPGGFLESLRIDPKDYNAQYYLKQVMLTQGEQLIRWEEFDKAETGLAEALTFLPGDPELTALLERARRGEVQ